MPALVLVAEEEAEAEPQGGRRLSSAASSGTSFRRVTPRDPPRAAATGA
eukprot:SAG22_NODE_199_length_15450_cov_11.690704_1_plen_48_part_10